MLHVPTSARPTIRHRAERPQAPLPAFADHSPAASRVFGGAPPRVSSCATPSAPTRSDARPLHCLGLATPPGMPLGGGVVHRLLARAPPHACKLSEASPL